MTIGQRIKNRRRELGLTQKQLGELCGMADSAIRKYESGKITPKHQTLQKIADALQVPVYDLTGIDFEFGINGSGGAIIKRARLKKGKTQEELATALGTTKATISRYEEGKLGINLKTACKIADILEMSWAEFYKGVPFDDYIRIRGEMYDGLKESGKLIDSPKLQHLIDTFNKLNELGQQKAIERLEELAEISKYLVNSE